MDRDNTMVDYMNKYLLLIEMYKETIIKTMDTTQIINTMNILVVIIPKIIILNIWKMKILSLRNNYMN